MPELHDAALLRIRKSDKTESNHRILAEAHYGI
jgi:hypothetical protein